MKLPYPQSINCAFDDFPAVVDIRLGDKAAELIPGASLGTKFLLTQTPKSRVLQGEYVAGEEIPDLAAIYSDTGSDDDFNIKISHLGYGTFYKVTGQDEFFRAMVYKAIVIETPTAGKKVFGDTFDCETLIPTTEDVTALFSYDGSVVRYLDQATAGEGGGVIVIGGVTYDLSDGQTITITSTTGGTQTITRIGRTFVVG